MDEKSVEESLGEKIRVFLKEFGVEAESENIEILLGTLFVLSRYMRYDIECRLRYQKRLQDTIAALNDRVLGLETTNMVLRKENNGLDIEAEALKKELIKITRRRKK